MAETVATYTVPQHHVQMYTNNIRSQLARQGGKLRAYVDQSAYVGERVQVVNFIGEIRFQKRTTRYGDTKVTEPSHTQRWLRGDEYDAAVLVDRLDRLKMIYDPTSPYVAEMAKGAARQYDQMIMDAMFDTALTGERGTTETAFPAADVIAHGSTGYTHLKMRTARKYFKQRFVDLRMERPIAVIESEGADDLLGDDKVINADFAAATVLREGEVAAFMGFTIIPMEGFVAVSGSTYRAPHFVMSGMHLGDWEQFSVVIGPRADKNNIQQAHATFTAGATRIEEGKVLEVQYQ